MKSQIFQLSIIWFWGRNCVKRLIGLITRIVKFFVTHHWFRFFIDEVLCYLFQVTADISLLFFLLVDIGVLVFTLECISYSLGIEKFFLIEFGIRVWKTIKYPWVHLVPSNYYLLNSSVQQNCRFCSEQINQLMFDLLSACS